MSGVAKSRWADADEDAAFEAKRRRQKEEKEERKRQKAAAKAKKQQAPADAPPPSLQATDDVDGNARPPKRRRVTPPPPTPPPPPPLAGGGKNDDNDDDDVDTDAAVPGAFTATPATTDDGHPLLRLGGGTLAPPCRRVERYDKLNDIEEGAYGWVARARDRASGAVVALKRLKLDPADRSGLPVTGLREIQLLRDCRGHRNIVGLREVVVGGGGGGGGGGGDDDDDDNDNDNDNDQKRIIYLVLDFVEHDLKSILEDMPQPFLASEVKTLLVQLARGVAFLHARCILHRDLKTSNLLLTNRGQLKIADFGMARYVAEDPSPPSETTTTPPPRPGDPTYLTPLVVTLWYRSPELLLGTPRYGRAVDLWSLGCIFGELLTREPLLQGKNEADQLARIFALCGLPSDAVWPGFRRLPNARALRLPPQSSSHVSASAASSTHTLLRARFPLLTAAGCDLLAQLLALDPARRPSAQAVLDHAYFRQDPRPKHPSLFPTFPSKAGQERRRRRDTPNAPTRGPAAAAAAAAALDAVDLTSVGLFGGRDKEERGAGFSLRMV